METLQPTNFASLTFCKPFRLLPEIMLTQNMGRHLTVRILYKGPLTTDDLLRILPE